MRKNIQIQKLVLVCGLLLILAGCGVKPRTVDAPAGVYPDRFPQTYPPVRRQDAPGDLPERYLPDGYRPASP